MTALERPAGVPVPPTSTPAGFTADVFGDPAPQGSKAVKVRHGRVFLVESSANVAPWREAISWQVRQQLPSGWVPLVGPVSVTAVFYLKRPKSAPKSRRYPATRPDCDKLARAVLDSLTGLAFGDDGQVVHLLSSKRYVGDDGRLEPGVVLDVRAVTS